MGIDRVKGVFGAVAAGSLMLSSTAAIASAPVPVQQADPWAVLTAMSGGAPAAAVCGAAAAATTTQGAAGCVLPVTDAVPPPPPPTSPVAVTGGGLDPIFLALFAIAAGIGTYFLVSSGGHPNSPA